MSLIKLRLQTVAGLLWIIGLRGAWAILVAGTDPSIQTNAPVDNPGFENVGFMLPGTGSFQASGVYIGSNWILTAFHVYQFDAPTGMVVNGISYAIEAWSWTPITNSTGSNADLIMARLASTPDIGGLTIASQNPPVNGAVTMIGNGRNRQTDLTYWNNSWVETNAANAAYSGYKWAAGQTIRWGTNQVDQLNIGAPSERMLTTVSSIFSTTSTAFRTTFNNNPGEGQGASGDSGGAVFYKRSGNWELSGIMFAPTAIPGQPANTSVFSNQTYAVNLATYRDQIVNTLAIPEPTQGALLLTGLLFAFRMRYRMRKL